MAKQRHGWPEHRLRLLATAIRLGFVPLALASLGDPGNFGTVLVGGAIAVAPVVVEQVRRQRVPAAVHVAVALAALVEATGRAMALYEGHPVPYDLFAHAVEVGAAVAIALTAIHARWPTIGTRSLLRMGVGAGAGLALGLGWEWVESAIDPYLSGTLQHGFGDTAQDILAGIVGALLAAVLMGPYWRATEADRATPTD